MIRVPSFLLILAVFLTGTFSLHAGSNKTVTRIIRSSQLTIPTVSQGYGYDRARGGVHVTTAPSGGKLFVRVQAQ
ncbi:MAG: hypothetical protein WCP35_14280 [Verrucomicrobiota bacterium]